jgi:heavy metal sensor kinase
VIAWWKRRSLKFRLAAWYSIGGILLLSAFSATVYFYVAYRIARPLDHQLQRDLLVVRQSLEVGDRGALRWRGAPLTASHRWPAQNPWFELWDGERNLVARFWPFDDSELQQLPVAPAPGRETISVFSIAPDVRVRVLSVPSDLNGAPGNWMLRVMTIHEPAVNALRELLAIIVVALPIVVVLLVFGGYAVTRRWLSPLDVMVSEANRITASDLNRRLPVANENDELGRLAKVFNVTLARLEDSFIALDRFVSDAAHELLTPLTTLRSVGEVGLRGIRSPEAYREVIGSMLEEAQRLQLLVEKLLQLARAEGGASILELKPVQLAVIADHCVEDARVLAEEKNQQVVLTSSPCQVLTDELLFRQALQNVLDNAIKYSPSGATIRVDVQTDHERCAVTVTDDGPGIPDEHRAELMQRFFRADKARVRATGGYGLGLAITKAYMRVLGGSITYAPRAPKGSVFTLSLPLAGRTAPQAAFPGAGG